jgi:hypothetical protein
MIPYTIEDARSFCRQLFATNEPETLGNDPYIIMSSTILTSAMYHYATSDVKKKITRLMFEMSLEEIVPMISDSYLCMFVEWRMRLGK